MTKNCEKHGDYESKAFKFHGIEILSGCPTCEREEEIKKEEEDRNAKLLSREIKLKSAGLGKRFHKCTIDNYTITCEGEKNALESAKQFISGEIENLFLIGSVGTGKTHLAAAILIGTGATYTTVSKMIRDIRRSYSDRTLKEQDLIDAYVNKDILIIDEIGVQLGTDSEKNLLFDVINGRYEELKRTVLISNLSIKGIGEYLGTRLMDRLKTKKSKLVVFDWESKRKDI